MADVDVDGTFADCWWQRVKLDFNDEWGGNSGATIGNGFGISSDLQAAWISKWGGPAAEIATKWFGRFSSAVSAAFNGIANGADGKAFIVAGSGALLDTIASESLGSLTADLAAAELGISLGPEIAGAIVGILAGQLASLSVQAAIEAAQDIKPDGDNDADDSPGGPKIPNPTYMPAYCDPLVLDLSGAGINLTALSGSPAYFDFTGSGVRTETGWIAAGEGLLVTAPADGATVTAANLLGALSGSGFADLAVLDSNGDGVIDSKDPGLANLRVWVNTSGTGASSAGELFTLAQLGIASINVNAVTAGNVINGNTVTATSTFTLTDAATGVTSTNAIAEVNFQSSNQITILPTSTTPLTQDALNLPNLDGFGLLPDLNVAVSLDPELETMVYNLVFNSATMTHAQFDAAFQAMVIEWAGATGVDPASKGPYIDARHLAVIYAYFGINPAVDTYYQQAQPSSRNGPALWEPTYRQIINVMETRFISQIGQSMLNYGVDAVTVQSNPYFAFALLGYDPSTNTLQGDVASLMSAVQSLAPSDPNAAETYWFQVLPVLKNLEIEVTGQAQVSLIVQLASWGKSLIAAVEASAPTDPSAAVAYWWPVLPALANLRLDIVGGQAGVSLDAQLAACAGSLMVALQALAPTDPSAAATYWGQVVPALAGIFAFPGSATSLRVQLLAYGAKAGFSPAVEAQLGQALFGPNYGLMNFGFGSGAVTIEPNQSGGQADILLGAGISAANVVLQADDATGNLTVELVDANGNPTGDRLTLVGELTDVTISLQDQKTPNADNLIFTDGSVLSLVDPTTFVGTATNTVLTGSNWGDNTFVLGEGGDTVTFGNGSARGGIFKYNLVKFSLGDGAATVNVNGGVGDIQLGAGITAANVLMQVDDATGNVTIEIVDANGNPSVVQQADATGNLGEGLVYVNGNPTGDSLTIENDFPNTNYPYHASIGSLTFADGSTMSLSDPTSTWIGTATNTVLTGSDWGANTFVLGAGGDTVNFGDGSKAWFSENSNLVDFGFGDGAATINLNGGFGYIHLNAGISSANVIMQADDATGNLTLELVDANGDLTGDSLTIVDQLPSLFTHNQTQNVDGMEFADGSYHYFGNLTSTWIATADNTVFTGSQWGENIFILGPGGDTVTFGQGNSTWRTSSYNLVKFGFGDGAATVNVGYDGWGDIQLGAGITAANVLQQADNATGNVTILLVDANGNPTGDSLTVVGGDLYTDYQGGEQSSLGQLIFADGSKVSLFDPTSTWIGTASNKVLTGSNWGANTFLLGAGGDTVTFGNGSAGTGATNYNLVRFGLGNDAVTVDVNGGVGDIQFGAGITAANVLVQGDATTGTLVIELTDGNANLTGDSLTLNAGLSQGGISAIDKLMFADGSTEHVSQLQLPPVAPVVDQTASVVAGSIAEIPGVTGSTATDAAAGAIAFKDLDVANIHTASVTGVAISGATSGLPSNAVLLSFLSLGSVAEETGATEGHLGWTFAAADSTFDYLAAGETVTLTYAVRIADSNGGATTQLVTVTISGTSGTSDTLTATGQALTLAAASSALTVIGSSDTVQVNGTGDVVSAGGGSAVIAATGVSFTATAAEAISLSAGASASVDAGGYADPISLSSNDSLTLTNNVAGAAVAATGGGNIVTASNAAISLTGSSSSLTVVGSNDAIVVSGTSDTVTASGQAVTLAAASSTLAVIGSSDAVEVDGAGDVVSAGGGSAVITATGVSFTATAAEAVSLSAGASATVDAGAAAGAISLSSGDSLSLTDNASGIVITAAGGGDTVTASNAVISLTGSSSGLTVVGSNDPIVVSGTSDTVTASGQAVTLAAASSTLAVVGSSDTVQVNGTGDVLSVNGDANTLSAGAGTNSLVATGNNEVYLAGAGNTTISNTSSSGSASGQLDITGGFTHNDLWFAQSGNDLVVDMMGTSQTVTISNWFGSPSNALAEISAGDGYKIDSGVSALVQVMATFETNNPSFDPTAAGNTTVPNDPTLQSALAAAWHT